jgi:outer membrane lipoprotein-sorting protein
LLLAVLLPGALLPELGMGGEEAGNVTAQEVVRRVNSREEGVSLGRRLRMELTSPSGKQKVRETLVVRKYFGDSKKTVLFFESPANLRGTAFLTFDYLSSDKDDDQWIYLPAARRVRRISASDRGESFFGTDFSYEEIKNDTRLATEDYSYRLLGTEQCDSKRCYRLEATPISDRVAEELGYGRVQVLVDGEIWMPVQFEVWDVSGNELKEIRFSDVRKVEDVWTVHRIDVKHLRTGHTTRFSFSEVEYDAQVDESIFSQHSLRRGPP